MAAFYTDKRNATGHQSTCKECVKAKARKWQQDNPERCRETAHVVYLRRAERMLAYPELVEARNAHRRNKYANDPDYREYRAQAARKYEAAKRAAKQDKIVSTEVFERDGYMCGICGNAVNPELVYPHRDAATVDHIIPFTRGGMDSWDNVQCAHFHCNSSKNNKLPTEIAA